MQINLQNKIHAGIIMDGNGRWAARRGLPRRAGHRAGVEALRRIAEAAGPLGVGTLTVYAFSSDNWARPPAEVSALMGLFRHYLRTETGKLIESDIRLTMIGRRDRLPHGLAPLIAEVEASTAHGKSLHLRIAFDYSARDEILRAAAAAANGAGGFTRQTFARLLSGPEPQPDVDLLIRTSGEQRLSDFLLWESAYAELHFTPRLWPDFGPEDLSEALDAFRCRDRRFGRLPTEAIAV